MIIGVDEVNFSPSLAGDCVVVALAAKRKVRGVKDSKLTSHKERLRLFEKLQVSSWYAVVPATVNDIADLNVFVARNLALASAVRMLLLKLRILHRWPPKEEIRVLVDGPASIEWQLMLQRWALEGKYAPPIEVCFEWMKDADEKVYEVSAASIVAKVYVDALFQGFGTFWPGYRMEVNHGSPDAVAYEKLRQAGPSPYHRRGCYGQAWWEKILGEKEVQ